MYDQLFTDKAKVASGLSHNHVIRAGKWTSSLHYDPANPDRCNLSIRVPVQALVVDEPWLRKRVGYDKGLDADDRRDIRKSMLDKDQLDAARHETILIRGRRCRQVDADRMRIDLDVRVRGRTKSVAPVLRVEKTQKGYRVRGNFTVRHEDFGFEPYSAFLGVVSNAEPIRFVADIRTSARD